MNQDGCGAQAAPLSSGAGPKRQTLRPYQAEATRLGVEFASQALAKGGSVLWLAHREELLTQARDRLLAEGLPRVGVIAAGEPTINAPVQVASIQTLAARASRGLPPGKVVVFDEAHHYAASTWGEVAML